MTYRRRCRHWTMEDAGVELKDPGVLPGFDFEFLANLLFLFGGIVYVISAVLAYFEDYVVYANHLNLLGALLYTIQALFSLSAWCDDRHMRVKHSRFRRRRSSKLQSIEKMNFDDAS